MRWTVGCGSPAARLRGTYRTTDVFPTFTWHVVRIGHILQALSRAAAEVLLRGTLITLGSKDAPLRTRTRARAPSAMQEVLGDTSLPVGDVEGETSRLLLRRCYHSRGFRTPPPRLATESETPARIVADGGRVLWCSLRGSNARPWD